MAKHKTFDLVSPGFFFSRDLCPVPFIEIDKQEESLQTLLEPTFPFYRLYHLKILGKVTKKKNIRKSNCLDIIFSS